MFKKIMTIKRRLIEKCEIRDSDFDSFQGNNSSSNHPGRRSTKNVSETTDFSCNFPFNITFCIGAPRSGTTLLSSLLSEGQNCAPMLPECTFITQLVQHYYNIINYSDGQRYAAYAISPQHLAGIYSASINKMVCTAAGHFQDVPFNYLILKDPELTLYVDLIPVFFGENCKVVCIIRNPIDVIASFIKVHIEKGENVDEAVIVNQVFNYYWVVHQSKLAANGLIFFVRFENIVQRNEDEFVGLESYLGYSIGRQGFGKVAFDFDRSDKTYSDNYGKPINSKTLSRASFVLSEECVNNIKTVFSGYNITYKWWGNA